MNTVKTSFTIHDLPVSERPRERLRRLGAEKVSTPELLAIVLGRGISGESVTVTVQRLFDRFGDIKGVGDATLEELTQVKGIGPAKASQIKAVFELAERRTDRQGITDKTKFKNPDEVFCLVKKELKDKKKEYFMTLLLDSRSRLIRLAEISIGSLDSSIVHPREVFKEAVSASAAAVIFVHNHPSGDPQPSKDDLALTQRLKEAGEIMGIDVLDHVIIGGDKFLSLKREGLL